MKPSKPIRALIIDDDPFMRDLLKDKLEMIGDVSVLDTAKDGQDGIAKISQHQPELVFLDVEMTDMTGFEMLEKLDQISFKTIFVTSYGHYAIKAIRFNALDYLLKPIDLQELKAALKRFRLQTEHQSANHVTRGIANMHNQVADQRLLLKTQEGEIDLLLTDIQYISGDRNYSNIHGVDGNQRLVAKTLSDLEELLDDKGFFRCHKSYLVNKTQVDQIKGDQVLLHSGLSIPVARRRKETFKTWLGKGAN